MSNAFVVRPSVVVIGYVGMFIALLITGGCASVPAEALAAQELVVKNIEVARQNQLELIDNYANDQRDHMKYRFENVALGKVVREHLGDRTSMPPDEVMKVALGYSSDLELEFGKIDDKARSLRALTNEDFDQLAGLARMNVELLNALSKQQKAVSALLGSHQKDLDAIKAQFTDALKTH